MLQIAFNGQHFREFRHRLPYQRVTHLGVEGDIQVSSVSGVMGCHGAADQMYNPVSSPPACKNIVS